ncbi:MAG: glycosyltransferase family 2 protein, partial [Arenicella sp.]|nr:glycosyltransferase family 2 protein [Arenicella sp.]
MAFISVIIPTFNRQDDVVEAIQSVLDQGDFDIEIIVVDDGSTDQTRQQVRRFGGACRYVFQPNGGPSAARNAGLKLAKGELISFLDSDDLWLFGKVEKDL